MTVLNHTSESYKVRLAIDSCYFHRYCGRNITILKQGGEVELLKRSSCLCLNLSTPQASNHRDSLAKLEIREAWSLLLHGVVTDSQPTWCKSWLDRLGVTGGGSNFIQPVSIDKKQSALSAR